jgi:hypothetical protein
VPAASGTIGIIDTVGAAKRRGPAGRWAARLPAGARLGEPPLANLGVVSLRQFPFVFPEIPGPGDLALSGPTPRRLGDLAGSRLPPLRKLRLQIEDPKFHIREPSTVVPGKSFESFVHYHHP